MPLCRESGGNGELFPDEARTEGQRWPLCTKLMPQLWSLSFLDLCAQGSGWVNPSKTLVGPEKGGTVGAEGAGVAEQELFVRR